MLLLLLLLQFISRLQSDNWSPAGCTGAGKDGDSEVHVQAEGALRRQLRCPGHPQQRVHLGLCHLPREVHGWGGAAGDSLRPPVPQEVCGSLASAASHLPPLPSQHH
uniref:Secreted protein n=1 Tax=Micrurus corallinus TaxID=54390 RepID=A0A2D4G360_MICCO